MSSKAQYTSWDSRSKSKNFHLHIGVIIPVVRIIKIVCWKRENSSKMTPSPHNDMCEYFSSVRRGRLISWGELHIFHLFLLPFFIHCYPFLVRVSAKLGTCTVLSVNGTLVEAKMSTFTLELYAFRLQQVSHLHSYDSASAKFRTNSHETDYSVDFLGLVTKRILKCKFFACDNRELHSTPSMSAMYHRACQQYTAGRT